MTAGSTCPYCNALLASKSDLCPVCGERLTSGVGTGSRPATTNPPRSSRKVAGMILGVMIVCALTGLVYALYTQADRRKNDLGGEIRPPRSPFDELPQTGHVVPVRPDQLPALGFLPPNLDLLVGLHFATLYEDPNTRTLLDQPLQVGPSRIRLADLQTWTGLAPSAIDHAVLGLGLPRAGLPRVLMVVRTRQAVDSEAIKNSLQAQRVFDAGLQEKKTLWNVRLGKLDLPAVLWIADNRTLVLGLSPADLAGLSSDTPLSQWSGATRELLTRRLDPGVALWVVGHLPEGLRGTVGLAVAGTLDRWKLTPEQRRAIEGLQSLAGGVVPGPEIVCRLALEFKDGPGANEVASWVQKPKLDEKKLKVVLDAAWVLVQWKTDRDRLLESLRR